MCALREQIKLYRQVGPVAYSLLSSQRMPRGGRDIKSEEDLKDSIPMPTNRVILIKEHFYQGEIYCFRLFALKPYIFQVEVAVKDFFDKHFKGVARVTTTMKKIQPQLKLTKQIMKSDKNQ